MSATAKQPEIEAYVAGVVESAAGIRMPELLEVDHPDVIYRVPDRNGVGTIILPTTLLTGEQLVNLLRYRMAQYMMVGFVDLEYAYEHKLEHEPASTVSPDDLHVIAMASETGEMLCYAIIEAPPTTDSTITLRDRDRPLFPAEQVHGWGIYNRLRILPDLPLSKFRELGRFVKNHRLHAFDELGARGAIEVGLALFRSLSGRLRLDVEAIIGDFEEGVAMQNLEFFQTPMIVIHGTIPYYPEAAYLYPRYQFRTVYPFAALSADVNKHMLSRLDAIEDALAQPGKQGMLALFALKRVGSTARSGLEPPGGLAELSETRLEQIDQPMPMRLEMLAAGDRLRQTNLFGGLSVSEAAILGTFMERVEMQIGDYIVRQGEMTDSLYLIESGEAEVRISTDDGTSSVVATLGAGEYVGEIALLTGEPRIADVIAITPMVVLQLTRDAYTRYLGHALEVEQNITRTALSRTRQTARHMTNNGD